MTVLKRQVDHRTATVSAVTVLTLLLAGVAAAYWLGGGSGSGSASTGTAAPVTLSPGTPTTQLYPGGQTSVVLTATNPNPASVRLESLVLDTSQGSGGFAVDGAHSACGLGTLSFTTQTNAGEGWMVPASSNLSITLTDALAMSTAAANACQGATFTVYLAAS